MEPPPETVAVKVVLASGSPRRSELLAREGLTFLVVPAQVEESKEVTTTPEDLALANASLKAGAIAPDYPDVAVLGADTIVVLEGRIFGKPRSLPEGAEMLRALSGRWHEVLTAVSIMHQGEKVLFAEETRVRFNRLSEETIQDYHRQVDVLDKAGGYAIQESGELIIAEVDGCRDNVMGLPVARVLEALQNLTQS